MRFRILFLASLLALVLSFGTARSAHAGAVSTAKPVIPPTATPAASKVISASEPVSATPTPQQLTPQERYRQLIVGYRESFRASKAIHELNKYLQLYPNDPWAFMQLSETYMLVKRYLEAEESANKAFELGFEPVGVTFQLARIYQHWGQKEMTRDYYTQLLDMAPDQALYYYEAGRFYYEIEDYSEAVRMLVQAVERVPESAEYIYVLAKALDASGDETSAIGMFERYIELQFEPPERYLRLGEMYMAKQLYAKAVLAYKKLESVTPQDFNTYMLLGKAYSGANDYPASIRSFLRASQINPDNPVPLLAMAQICRMAQDNDRALQVYLRVLALDDRSVDARFGRGQIFAMKRQLDRAEFEIRKALQYQQNSPQIYALLAAILHEAGREEEAQQALEFARETHEQADLLYEKYLEIIPPAEADESAPKASVSSSVDSATP